MNTARKYTFATTAALALFAGCQTVDGIKDNVGERRIFGSSVEGMDQTFSAALRSEAGLNGPVPANLRPARITPEPPKTFFLSENNAQSNDNYWLRGDVPVVNSASQVVYNPAARAYVQSILEKLLATAPTRPERVQVHIVGANSFNAVARENGDIFINTGALVAMNNESELAYLLAHELSHLLLKHSEKARLFESQRDLASYGVGAIALATTVSNLDVTRGVNGIDFNISKSGQGAIVDKTMSATAVKMGADFVGNEILGAGWNRADEEEADLLAVDLMVAAGYSPRGYGRTFGNFETGSEQRAAIRSSFERRAEEKTAALEKSFETNGPNLAAVIDTGSGIFVDGVTTLANLLRNKVARGHPEPKTRVKRVRQYGLKFHAAKVAARVRTDPAFKRKIAQLRIPQINDAYKQVGKALQDIEGGNHDEALRNLAIAFQTPEIGSDPFPRMAQAMAYRAKGDRANALSSLRRIAPSAPLPLEGYLMRAELETAERNRFAAEDALRKGEDNYGPQPVAPSWIATLVAFGENERALTQLATCKTYDRPAPGNCRSVALATGLVQPQEARPSFFSGNPLFGGSAAGTTPASTIPAQTPDAAAATVTEPKSPIDGAGAAIKGLFGTLTGGI